MKISWVVSTIAFVLLTACSLSTGTGMELAQPAPTPFPIPPGTLVPTAARETHSVTTPTLAPTSTALAYDCAAQHNESLTTYGVNAEMQYVKHIVKVAQSIAFTNKTGTALSSLVLNIKTNWAPGIFKLHSINLLNGTPLPARLSEQQLQITLPQPLQQDCIANLNLDFELRLPPIEIGGPHAYQGYLGYSNRQTNLGQWLPTIAEHGPEGWITHEEIGVGEQDVLEIADWDIDFHVTGAPGTIQIAAPGTIEQKSSTEWHFQLNQARDFSLSIGENYRILQQETSGGVNVELFSFENPPTNTDKGAADSAAYALNIAVKSLNLYESVYGKYPLSRLVIVEGDFPDGMEFSGMVFVGGEYFRGLNGVQSYLTIITAHEIAHQWWYARVGNDQAIYPWLDEALATYSELIFIEKYYPTLADWWWNFRVNRLNPQGFVDSTVYDFTSRRAYINAVYLRGVQMLRDIRAELGDDVFFGWLNRYAAAGTGKVMSPDQFWNLLTSEQQMRTASIRQQYLRQSDVSPAISSP